MTNLIPQPVVVKPAAGTFTLAAGANIYVAPGTVELTAIGRYLADKLNPATGYWSPAQRDWKEYKVRLGAHGPRFAARGGELLSLPTGALAVNSRWRALGRFTEPPVSGR